MHDAHLIVSPLLPPWLLGVLAALGLAFAGYALAHRMRGAGWRLAAMTVLLGWLCGPQWLVQNLRTVPLEVAVVLDRSASMQVGDRATSARGIVDALRAEAAKIPGLTLRVVEGGNAAGHGTRLFEALDRADLAPDRFGGAIFVTDGEVTDTPPTLPDRFHDRSGHGLPLHVLLTARGEEEDRVLHVLQAPPFAIVGHDAMVRVMVEDRGPGPAMSAHLTITRAGQPPQTVNIEPGIAQDIPVPITQSGEMLVGLSVSERSDEVSSLNNRTAIRINGLRDRLKVLLVSGAPNQAERVWRRLLKADPSVDLVHFTILRPSDRTDDTPASEMSLIPFPVDELFNDKIRQFDLIILDQFQNRRILPQSYLRNIADFVQNGGGLLVTSGPEFTQTGSLQDGPLGDILPAHVPADGVVVQRFTPGLTDTGLRHPVTAGLPGAPTTLANKPGWGPWYRALRPDTHHGEALLEGPDGQPMLLLDHVGEGRVAQLLSDQSWLWSRKAEGDGGGPQAELLRRLAHWLMKEPELEENRLSASLADGHLRIVRHSIVDASDHTAIVTAPDGHETRLTLTRQTPGVEVASLPVSADFGIWRVTSAGLTAFASPPDGDPLELADLRATAQILKPLAHASGGAAVFAANTGSPPTLRLVAPGDATHGNGWLGFPRHLAQVPGDAQTIPLLPAWCAVLAAIVLSFIAWWREGRRR